MGTSPQEVNSEANRDFQLTAQELQVIALIAAGCTDEDLARKLGIRQVAAKRHLTKILGKVGALNTLDLMLMAAYYRWIN